MYDSSQDLLDALRATPTILTTLVHNYTQRRTYAARSKVIGWSVFEVLWHLREKESEALTRIRAIRDLPGPLTISYNHRRPTEDHPNNPIQLHYELTAFLEMRAQHISELEQLKPEQWELSGQYEEQGLITISAETLHTVAHDCVHLAQIARQVPRASTSGWEFDPRG